MFNTSFFEVLPFVFAAIFGGVVSQENDRVNVFITYFYVKKKIICVPLNCISQICNLISFLFFAVLTKIRMIIYSIQNLCFANVLFIHAIAGQLPLRCV